MTEKYIYWHFIVHKYESKQIKFSCTSIIFVKCICLEYFFPSNRRHRIWTVLIAIWMIKWVMINKQFFSCKHKECVIVCIYNYSKWKISSVTCLYAYRNEWHLNLCQSCWAIGIQVYEMQMDLDEFVQR